MRVVERTVSCRGRDARVEVVGEGPDVVVVGTAAPIQLTRDFALELAGLGHRVVNFDYGSGHESPEPRTAIDQVSDVIAVMDALEVDRGALVGVSRGAMTAYALASRHPGRVTSLVLALPVAGFADTMLMVDPYQGPGDDGDVMAAILSQVFSESYLAANRETAAHLLTIGPGSVDRVERADEEPFGDDTVSCPTLVIEGGADRVVSSAHPKRYVDAIPGARLVRVDGAGHGWVIEQPGAFAELVAAFVPT